MPKDTHTPSRNFRANAEDWYGGKAKAREQGETITDALLRFLRAYRLGKAGPLQRP